MNNHPILKSGFTLAIIAAVCTGLVAFTWQLTTARIAANEQAWLERSLQPALSGLYFDNNVTESKITLQPPHDLPGSGPAIIYRVYAGDQPVAALFVVTARDGYTAPIRVLVGIDVSGAVTGVRVIEHRETPGLGDRIEASRSDWVLQFDGHSLRNPQPAGWAIKRDGGEYDQITGASVTPRAVIKAIKETLQYFDVNADAIFAAKSDADAQEVD